MEKFRNNTANMIAPTTGTLSSNTVTMNSIWRIPASVPSVKDDSHIVMVVMVPKRSMIYPPRDRIDDALIKVRGGRADGAEDGTYHSHCDHAAAILWNEPDRAPETL